MILPRYKVSQKGGYRNGRFSVQVAISIAGEILARGFAFTVHASDKLILDTFAKIENANGHGEEWLKRRNTRKL